MNIQRNIDAFMKRRGDSLGRTPHGRYASFDYCFNYFQAHRRKASTPQNIEKSCLELGFYLASWGMYRGSTLLLKRSARFLQPVISAIAEAEPSAWDIDVDKYNEPGIVDLLFTLSDRIKQAFKADNGVTQTLVTKVMLGVFGSVPAFDTNFNKGFSTTRLSRRSLNAIYSFYVQNKPRIDELRIHTIDFATGKETKTRYTKAKLIDMIFFIEGLKKQGYTRVQSSRPPLYHREREAHQTLDRSK